jgi:LysR family glycine cleavage system transcriptional activator
MSKALPSLVALRAFEAVARTGSVRAAGDELAVSHTSISRHLQNLQDSLGVDLVRPQGRNIILTDAGRALSEKLQQAFETIVNATEAVKTAKREPLKVWCTPGLAHRRLLRRLPDFLSQKHGSEIDLKPTLDGADLFRRTADAMIVYGNTVDMDDGFVVEPLARAPRMYPVASPKYLSSFKPISGLKELATFPLIHEVATDRWANWFRLAGLETFPPLNGLRLWHAHVTLEAARLGQGIALGNDILVEDEILSGELLEVLSSSVCTGTYQLIVRKERITDPQIVALRKWLREALTVDDLIHEPRRRNFRSG